MRPLRLLLSLCTSLLAVTLLLYMTLALQQDDQLEQHPAAGKQGGFRALLSFTSPGSLFPPSAIISLTDDNSTFFLARPAAFGPTLPSDGLSSGLWIGSGFGDDILGKGELGCGDSSDRDRDNSRLELDSAAVTGGRRESRGHDIQSLQESAEIDGKVVLLRRGQCGFLAKVLWAQRRGAVAVIVGDNVRGGALIRMYAKDDTSNVTIPSLFTSHTTAHLLSSLLPGEASATPAIRRGAESSSLPATTELLDDVSPGSGESSRTPMRDSEQNSWWPKWFAHSNEHVSIPKVGLIRGRSITSLADMNLDKIKTFSAGSAPHKGLWVTLTPTNVSTSPFFDTLLVLVVSPLVTLTVVYALLLLRSRIRRRRWRAPKSLVERLPVRTYQTISDSTTSLSTSGRRRGLRNQHAWTSAGSHQPSARTLPSGASSSSTSSPASASRAPSARPSGATTPLLYHSTPQPTSPTLSRHSHSGDEGPATSSAARNVNRTGQEEKRETGLAEWRRRYGGRQKECVICLDEYVDGVSQVMSLPCGHEFHADCITPWLVTRRRTCPICKGDVVRSLAQSHHDRPPSPSPTRSAPHLDTLDDVQVQAAEIHNDSHSASLPMPISTSAPVSRSRILDDDVEANWSDESQSASRSASANRAFDFSTSFRDLSSTVSTVIWRGVEVVRSTTGFQRRSLDDT